MGLFDIFEWLFNEKLLYIWWTYLFEVWFLDLNHKLDQSILEWLEQFISNRIGGQSDGFNQLSSELLIFFSVVGLHDLNIINISL